MLPSDGVEVLKGVSARNTVGRSTSRGLERLRLSEIRHPRKRDVRDR
jgi:hypothetical protein